MKDDGHVGRSYRRGGDKWWVKGSPKRGHRKVRLLTVGGGSGDKCVAAAVTSGWLMKTNDGGGGGGVKWMDSDKWGYG